MGSSPTRPTSSAAVPTRASCWHRPRAQTQPEVEPAPESEISPRADQEAGGQSGPDDQAARLDRLVGQTAKAALRFAAEEATRKARAEYAARLEREAHAEPEHIVRA